MLRRGASRKHVAFCPCPLPKQEPHSVKNPANRCLLGRMAPRGETAGAGARRVLVAGSAGTDLIVERVGLVLSPLNN